MWMHHPKIARRWTKKYGSKPRPKKKKDKNFYENVKIQTLY